MGLFLRQDDSRSELQSRIAAELQEKLKTKPDVTQDQPEPAFLENQHQTRPAGMFLMILAVVFVVAVVVFALYAGGVL